MTAETGPRPRSCVHCGCPIAHLFWRSAAQTARISSKVAKPRRLRTICSHLQSIQSCTGEGSTAPSPDRPPALRTLPTKVLLRWMPVRRSKASMILWSSNLLWFSDMKLWLHCSATTFATSLSLRSSMNSCSLSTVANRSSKTSSKKKRQTPGSWRCSHQSHRSFKALSIPPGKIRITAKVSRGTSDSKIEAVKFQSLTSTSFKLRKQ